MNSKVITCCVVLLLFILVGCTNIKTAGQATEAFSGTQKATVAVSQCTTNQDCKLIYSSCHCLSVPQSDLRPSYQEGTTCNGNSCQANRLHAACVKGTCTALLHT